MRRRVFNAASAISLLLCVTLIVLWVRSYFVADTVWFIRNGIDEPHDHGDLSDKYGFVSTHGGFRIELERRDDRNGTWPPPKPTIQVFRFTDSGNFDAADVDHSQYGSWQRCGLGFAVGEEDYRGNHSTGDYRYVVFPHWFLAGLLGLMATPLLRRRRMRGVCSACSYNLTGNTSGICPECGTPVPKEPAEKSPRPARAAFPTPPPPPRYR
jgi:hypothetical protein